MAALALAWRRPEVELLLVEQSSSFGGNHIWSFFDSDLHARTQWLADLVGRRHWSDHEVRFPNRRRVLGLGYNSIRSTQVDAAVRSLVPSDRRRTGVMVSALGADFVLLESGERIAADCVIDARGALLTRGIELGWQKFVGRLYRSSSDHGIERPVIMDATQEQRDGYRFLYLLPFSANELLVEDTYYSSSPLLDRSGVGASLDELARGISASPLAEIAEESGVLPVVIAGRLETLWPKMDRLPRIGMRGGFYHPTTGYSLPDALVTADLISRVPELTSAAVGALLRSHAERLWRKRRFFQLLNRMLFRAATPSERYRVLEHFYRLPEKLVGRFYAGELGVIDKLRILSGRPPVPIASALLSLRSRPAL